MAPPVIASGASPTTRRMAMADDKSARNSPDNKRIDVNDPDEVRNWTKALGVTPERLKEAVAKVSTSVEAVRAHLEK
jgi:hypothetical protein